MPRIWAEVHTPSGECLGVVPLVSCEITRKLDDIGNIKLTAPATMPVASLLATKRTVKLYRRWLGQKQFLGQGILEQKSTAIGSNQKTITWQGLDQLTEFQQRYTGRGRTYANRTFYDVVKDLINLKGGWGYGIADGGTLSDRFDGISAWQAILSIARKKGYHVRLGDVENRIEIGSFGEDKGKILANPGQGAPWIWNNSDLVPITQLNIGEESYQLFNWAEVVAGGDGEAALTLEFSTRSSPYIIETDTGPDGEPRYFIKDDASIAEFGQIEQVINVKEVVPVSSESGEIGNAADLAYDYAASLLQRLAQPVRGYTASATKMDDIILPGDKVTLAYKGYVYHGADVVDYADVKSKFWVLSTAVSYGASMRASIEIAEVDIRALDALDALAGVMREVSETSLRRKLKVSARKVVEETGTVDNSTPAVVSLENHRDCFRFTRALLTISREDSAGPDTLTIDVDGQRVLNGPYLSGVTSDEVSIDIKNYLNSGALPIPGTHTVAIECNSGSGILTITFDIAEAIVGDART